MVEDYFPATYCDGRAIKRDVKDASYPDEVEWKNMVWERGREVVEIALRRIGA